MNGGCVGDGCGNAVKHPKSGTCEKCYQKAYRAANRERLAAYKRERYESNKEEHLAKCAARYVEKKDTILTQQREYYVQNKPAILARVREYREGHKDEIARTEKIYRMRNTDKLNAKTRKWRERNPDRKLAQDAAYRERHADRIKERMNAWLADNAERASLSRRERGQRRKALKFGSIVTRADLREVLADYGMHCHICDSPIVGMSDLHFDHVIPLSKGGPHSKDNIKPAHAKCNLSKGARILAGTRA